MPVDSTILMQRLSLIKYLYMRGIEQSRLPETLAAFSLHDFHDSVEMFMRLALEHMSIGAKNSVSFMQYWENLAPELPNGFPSQKESMRRLNTARGSLKHQGITPSVSEIEGFRAATTNFFYENCSVIFEIEFSEISMVNLIKYKEAKKHLQNAQDHLSNELAQDAINEAAKAFALLIDEYEENKRAYYGQSPFFFGESMAFYSSVFMDIDFGNSKIANFIDATKSSIEALQNSVKFLSLGLNYRKLSKFQMLTPQVIIYPEQESRKIDINLPLRKYTPTIIDAKYCYDFVIESALHFQEFDYEAITEFS